jgi:ABC-2 type transport system permease protein
VTALIRSEARKIAATRRTMIVLGLALLAIVAVGTAGTVESAADDPFDHDRRAIHDVLSGAAGTAVFFALIVGVLIVTWEYHHRTMTHTLLGAPRRERVLGAKAVAGLACGLGFAAAAVVLGLLIALPWLGAGSELGRDDLWTGIGRVLLGSAVWGVLGIAVGALVASQVGALISALVWLLVAEPILGAVPGDVYKYLPGHAMQSLLGFDSGVLSTGAGIALSAAYLAAFSALGVVATLRRDIV